MPTILLSMPASHSIAEAKAHFAACVADAESGKRVILIRHGRPVAALVPIADLDRLESLGRDDPQAGLAGLIGAWEEDEEMVDVIQSAIASRTGPRPLPKWESE